MEKKTLKDSFIYDFDGNLHDQIFRDCIDEKNHTAEFYNHGILKGGYTFKNGKMIVQFVIDDSGKKIYKNFEENYKEIYDKNQKLIERVEYYPDKFGENPKIITPFMNNKIHGKVVEYDPNKKIICEQFYTQGRLDKRLEYSNEILSKEMIYVNNVLHGDTRIFYPSGKLKEKIPYYNNQIHGINEEYYENGKLKSQTPYSVGKKNGVEKFYNKKRELIREIEFKDGQKVSEKVHGTKVQ